jgi:chromosome segregation ATPase
LEEEEDTSRTVVLGEASDDVNTKLRDILQLLNQDIGLLVQDAEGVKDIFRHLKGQLPADVEVALLPAAIIEVH